MTTGASDVIKHVILHTHSPLSSWVRGQVGSRVKDDDVTTSASPPNDSSNRAGMDPVITYSEKAFADRRRDTNSVSYILTALIFLSAVRHTHVLAHAHTALSGAALEAIKHEIAFDTSTD